MSEPKARRLERLLDPAGQLVPATAIAPADPDERRIIVSLRYDSRAAAVPPPGDLS